MLYLNPVGPWGSAPILGGALELPSHPGRGAGYPLPSWAGSWISPPILGRALGLPSMQQAEVQALDFTAAGH